MGLLDSLNKLYVAMTRAKERLYVFSKFLPDKIKADFVTKGNLNSFLYQYDDNFPIIIGDGNMMRENKEEVLNTFPVVTRRKLDWREVLRKFWETFKKLCDDTVGKSNREVMEKINDMELHAKLQTSESILGSRILRNVK